MLGFSLHIDNVIVPFIFRGVQRVSPICFQGRDYFLWDRINWI